MTKKYTYDDPDIKSYQNKVKVAHLAIGYESSCREGLMFILLPYISVGKDYEWTEDKIAFGNKEEALEFCKEMGWKFEEDND